MGWLANKTTYSNSRLIMILLTIFYVSDLHFTLRFAMHLTNFLYKMVSAVFSGFVASMAVKDCEDSGVILKW